MKKVIVIVLFIFSTSFAGTLEFYYPYDEYTNSIIKNHMEQLKRENILVRNLLAKISNPAKDTLVIFIESSIARGMFEATGDIYHGTYYNTYASSDTANKLQNLLQTNEYQEHQLNAYRKIIAYSGKPILFIRFLGEENGILDTDTLLHEGFHAYQDIQSNYLRITKPTDAKKYELEAYLFELAHNYHNDRESVDRILSKHKNLTLYMEYLWTKCEVMPADFTAINTAMESFWIQEFAKKYPNISNYNTSLLKLTDLTNLKNFFSTLK